MLIAAKILLIIACVFFSVLSGGMIESTHHLASPLLSITASLFGLVAAFLRW